MTGTYIRSIATAVLGSVMGDLVLIQFWKAPTESFHQAIVSANRYNIRDQGNKLGSVH